MPSTRVTIPASIIAVILLAAIIAASWFHHQERQQISATSRHVIGQRDAPYHIIEFADFQCPYCATFSDQALSPLKHTLIANGAVRFEYRHYPFLGPQSENAAIAAECAAQQDAFWEYHDLLYVNTFKQNPLDKSLYDQLVAFLELDAEAWQTCYDGSDARRLVQADKSYGRKMGVQGTPAVFINGQPYAGAHDYFAIHDHLEALEHAPTEGSTSPVRR